MIDKRCYWLAGLFWVAAQIAIATIPHAAHATEDGPDLLALIETARTTFQPVTSDDVARAKATVRDRLIATSQAVWDRQQWRDYLLWDEQFQEFDRTEPGGLELWRLAYARAARDATALDWEVFQQYRAALLTLIRRIEATKHPDFEAEYQSVLTELAAMLPSAAERLDVTDAARMSVLLATLQRHGQAPELVEAIRALAAGPNLIIEIPATMLASERHVEEEYTFRQNIRGSTVEGSGTLKADQSSHLDAGENEIIVKTTVTGTSNSLSLGFGSGVTVRSSGSLRFGATANVIVDLEGVAASAFDSQGYLASQILGVSTNYRRRADQVARQSVYNRQEADRQAAQERALFDLSSTFDTRLDGELAPVQATYRKHIYLPLARHDRLPTKSRFFSDAKRATAQVWLADDGQLAAPGVPPWSGEAGERLRLAIHESAVNNTSALLEGRVRSLVSVLNGEFFEYIAEMATASQRIDIRFHDQLPVRAVFRDRHVEIRLAGAEYLIDGSTYPGMEITLSYELEENGSPVLRLSEPPRVMPRATTATARPRVGLRGIALRRILSNVLKEHVPDTIDLNELTLPESLGPLGKLQTKQIAIEDGWLLVEAVSLGGQRHIVP